jgi:capsular polysaccharide transport system permease protein
MSYLRGLATQAEVVYAIVLRETRTRFGAHKLGYLWALIEPSLVILTFVALFRIVGRDAPSGMDLFGFLATGILPYTLFASSVARVAESINGNKALLYYPQVRPLDLAIARGALEAATFVTVFLLLMGGRALVRQELVIDSPLLIIAGLALASLVGTAVGLIFCALAQVSNAVDRARGPLMRPLFWISGIFFTAEALPASVQGGLLLNPVLQATELVRAGWYLDYDARHVTPLYCAHWILGALLIALLLERGVRRRIEMT